MAHELAFRGYDVIIAARNSERAKELVLQIQQKLDKSIIVSTANKEVGRSEGSKLMPKISFIEYHADIHQSALDLASKLETLESTKPLTVLINNAGIMGASQSSTMKVNLLGPALLTFALLPLMMKKNNDNHDDETRRRSIKIINVSSSAHLRAACVFEEDDLRMKSKSLMSIFSNSLDDNLSTYAKSKLALLQFSTLLRHKLPKDKDIHILDAHPGLVWTSLLRNHIGDSAENTLQKTGLAGLIYKSPSEGAQAILACLDHSPITNNDEQVYFVNGEPGGYASPESRDLHQSELLLDRIIAPELRGIVKFPEGL
jgi:NAD(P)-dependent dehydrogenase (short-subunit alcohol dehydrogenase family)